MFKILFLTTNQHKMEEARALFSKYNIHVEMLDREKIEIQSEKLEEIVFFALKSIDEKFSYPVMVEDAGLFIKHFNGFPGPYSSYVFKKIGNQGILKLMKGVKERDAYFYSVVGLKTRKGLIKVFTGRVDGKIATEERGERKFGYDPIFIPLGYSSTFAEMEIYEKNRISHRSRAFVQAITWILNNIENI
ncbi:MAG: non-canonical purine NTP pyrophosphatase, RdgB/HAM1 family [Thermofilum sp. ex4484_79]|nr:MAG: non-canonical purine NTP pyrophosphatase, RdgB/HAM1 family [Thermofilum sp. ex4484_79]